jgi:hypothetical protein
MRQRFWIRLLSLTSFCLVCALPSALIPQDKWQAVYLPSGKILVEPPAGRFISDLIAFPINSASSPDGRYLAFLNNVSDTLHRVSANPSRSTTA